MKEENLDSKNQKENLEEIIPFPHVLAECVTEILYDDSVEDTPASVVKGRSFVSSLGFLFR